METPAPLCISFRKYLFENGWYEMGRSFFTRKKSPLLIEIRQYDIRVADARLYKGINQKTKYLFIGKRPRTFKQINELFNEISVRMVKHIVVTDTDPDPAYDESRAKEGCECPLCVSYRARNL